MFTLVFEGYVYETSRLFGNKEDFVVRKFQCNDIINVARFSLVLTFICHIEVYSIN